MRLAVLGHRVVFGTLGMASLVAAVIAIPSLGQAQSGPVSFRLSVSRHVLEYHGRSATLSMQMRTGASAESVAIDLAVSSWPEGTLFGSPLSLTRERILGAGRITSHFVSSCCQVPATVCDRGGPPAQGGGVDLSLPADSTTTLQYDLKLAAPPWPSTALSVVVRASIPAVSNDPSALHSYALGTRRFTARGPSGVHITLSAAPRPVGKPAPGAPVLAAEGRTISVAGRTMPRVKHQVIQLGYTVVQTGNRPTTTRTHGPLDAAKTGDQGGFRIAWRPPRSGLYVITAAYRHPTRGLLADRACDLAIAVK